MQKHEWATACDLADEIIVAARKVKVYCLDQLEQENADQQERT
jgi:hypothetical protein